MDSGDDGISSRTIWSVMTGRRLDSVWQPDVHYDPADFGRCHRLLLKFPAWVPRMPEVAAAHPEWSALVAHWSELTELYEQELPSGRAPLLWDRMEELREDQP